MQQQSRPRPQASNKPVILTEKHGAVLVKWNFTNYNHVPPGVEIRDRVSDQNVDKITTDQASKVGAEHLAAVGRLREGRVDTGHMAYGNVLLTRVGFTRRALRDQGFRLKDLYAYVHRQPGKTDKFVVMAIFERQDPGAPPTVVSAEQRNALELLEKKTAWTLWVYDNLDLKTAQEGVPRRVVTVNLVQLSWLTGPDGQPNGTRPQNMIVLRNGALTVEPFKAGDEDIR